MARHGCKQSIRNKPVRFGFKAWCLNSRLGYLTVFNIYQGSTYGSTNDYEKRFGKGGGTLLILLDKLPLSIESMLLEFYFDNYFTGLPLLNQLSLLNYGGTGTIRENRVLKDCPLKSTKVIKRGKRGAIDIVFDDNHNLALGRWKDNAIVTLASNQHVVAPVQKARRWSFVENKRLTVDQPFVVHRYNTYMGGTDRLDQNINFYRTTIRTKKWW